MRDCPVVPIGIPEGFRRDATERVAPGGAGAVEPQPRAGETNLTRNFSETVSRRAASVVRLLVPLGEFKEDYFFALVVDIVQQAIRAYAKAVLGGEL